VLSESQQQLYDQMAKSVVPWAERTGLASQTSDGRFIGPSTPPCKARHLRRLPVLPGSRRGNSSLTPRTRQVVILAVSAVRGSGLLSLIGAHQTVCGILNALDIPHRKPASPADHRTPSMPHHPAVQKLEL
jgi:hypothetical protein